MNRGVAVIRFALLGLVGGVLPVSAHELEVTWERDATSNYASATILLAHGLGGPHALVAEVDASHLFGRFFDEEGETHVSSPGGAVMLGYRLEIGGARLTLASGCEARRTWERPRGGLATRDDEFGVTGMLEAVLDLGGFAALDADATASEIDHYRWAGADLIRRLLSMGPLAVSAGPEVAYEESFESRSTQWGAMLVLESLGSGQALELRAGATRMSNPDGSVERPPYLGAGLSKEW